MQTAFPVKNYDLALTLASGQTFRWRRTGDVWEGIIGSRWVRLGQEADGIRAETACQEEDWQWLRHYLQTEVELDDILALGGAFEAIEEQGVEDFLQQIRDELIGRRYLPLRARKKEIPKDGGRKVRVLSIPSIRDRVVQGLAVHSLQKVPF